MGRSFIHPDDLLVNEGAVLLPNRFEERLLPAGMPAIPGSVGRDGRLDGHSDKGIVEGLAKSRAVDVCVFIRPVLVSGVFPSVGSGPFVGVVRAVPGMGTCC